MQPAALVHTHVTAKLAVNAVPELHDNCQLLGPVSRIVESVNRSFILDFHRVLNIVNFL